MNEMTAPDPRRTGQAVALLCAAIAFIVIAAALVLEHGFGYAPCPLCLQQRWPYYIGIPAALIIAALAPRLPGRTTGALLLALAALFAWGSGMGIYQAGAEWRFWPGPMDCGAGAPAGPTGEVGGLLDAIQSSTVVSCTDPALRIFGLSLAGWNAVVMAFLFIVAVFGAVRVLRSR